MEFDSIQNVNNNLKKIPHTGLINKQND